MKKLTKFAVIGVMLVAVGVLSGCGALNNKELQQYNEWKESGELVKVKSPGGALALGLLPGGGSFYTGKVALGILDLLLWAPSAIWDGPIAYTTAKRINYDATAEALNNQ